MKFKSSKPLYVWGIGSAVALLLLLTPFAFISYLLPIVLLAAYWPQSKLLNSWILRLAFAFVITVCFQQVAGIFFWAVKFPYSLPQAVITELLLVLGLLVYNRRLGYKPTPLITRDDVTSLTVSVASIAVLLYGTLAGGPVLPQLVRFSTTGFDHTSHISMILSIYDNHGYAYGPANEATAKVIYRDFVSYPEGWHLNGSILWQSLSKNLNTSSAQITKTLFFYLMTVMLWYGALLYFFCRIVLLLVSKFTGVRSTLFTSFGAFGFTLLCQVALLFGMLRYGFSSYLPVLLFSLLVTLLIIEHETEPKTPLPYTLVTLSLLTAGLTLSWLLALPLGVLPILYIFIDSIGCRPRQIFTWVRQNVIACGLIFILAVSAVLQFYIQVAFNQKINQLNEAGAIGTVNYGLLSLALVGSIIGVVYLKKKAVIKGFWYALSGSLLLTGGIYAYQYYSAMKPSYYSAKVGFLSMLLLLVFFASISIVYLEKVMSELNKLVALVVFGCLLLFLPFALGLDMPVLSYASGDYRKLSPYAATQVSALLKTNDGQEGNVVIAKKLDYDEDLVSTHFLQMLSRSDADCQHSITWYLLSNDTPKLLDKLNTCGASSSKPYYVFVSGKNIDAFKGALNSNSKVKVILTN